MVTQEELIANANELAADFDDLFSRRKLISVLKDVDTALVGENENGETVVISSSESGGMMLLTYQNNGWTRTNYYDECGYLEGEMFNGRWKDSDKPTAADPFKLRISDCVC